MTKLELSKSIAQDLLDNDCLNLADIPGLDKLLDTVTDLIMYRLEDYKMLRGEIF
jgi:hypothetical protein